MIAQRQRYLIDVHQDTVARHLYFEPTASDLEETAGALQRSCDKNAETSRRVAQHCVKIDEYNMLSFDVQVLDKLHIRVQPTTTAGCRCSRPPCSVIPKGRQS